MNKKKNYNWNSSFMHSNICRNFLVEVFLTY